jgi:hypothetical protein
LLNLIATGCAPLFTALATDYLFADDLSVGKSLALVCGTSTAAAAATFLIGLELYAKMARKHDAF